MDSNKELTFLKKKTIKIKKPKKFLNNKNLNHIKGPWTTYEDLMLRKWVEEHGPKNWRLCSKNIPGRNQSQCRQHWNIKLKPNLIVGNWTSKEIFLIIVFYKKFNGSWKKIVPIFKSRTENAIKNIFFSQTRKIVSNALNKTGKKKKSYNLFTLLKYYHIIYNETKKKFLEDNPMSEEELEEYIKNIEIMLENKPKKEKYIDIELLGGNKNNNNYIINNENNNESTLNKKSKMRNEILKTEEKKNIQSIKSGGSEEIGEIKGLIKESDPKIGETKIKENNKNIKENEVEDNTLKSKKNNLINSFENYLENNKFINNINNNCSYNYFNIIKYHQISIMNNYIYCCDAMNSNINKILNYNNNFIKSLITNSNDEIYSNNNYYNNFFDNINNYFL